MRRLELLIEAARRQSLNKEYSTTIGISQEEFVDYANKAQRYLVREIIKKHPRFFQAETTITPVSQQEAYDVASDVHLGKIDAVEYSTTGQTRDYYKLRQYLPSERANYPAGSPVGYIRRNQQILLVPPPISGGPERIRVTYTKRAKRLEIRRAQIQSVTVTDGAVTALTLTPATIASLDPGGEFAKYNHLCVVDRDGAQKLRGLEYDSVNTSTGVVAITSGSFAIGSGESVSVGDYVVIGEDSENLPSIVDDAEDFLISYMASCALDRDGSEDGADQKAVAEALAASIVDAFADPDSDVMDVPILDYSCVGEDF